VDYDGTSIDTVMARTGLEVSTVLSRLSELESVNHVKDIGGWWQRS
jgi:predicted Rossmann fold nucleotide-binding protein DprA/Smf involved in DNA uptake